MPFDKLSVIVPFFNEATTLETSINAILEVDVGIEVEIITVDDGSSDGFSVCDSLKDSESIICLSHATNRGKGAAIRTGLQKATGNIVVIQDADLEYNPQEWIKMIPLMTEGTEQVVYGSRFLGKIDNMSLKAKIANLTLTRLTNLLFKSNLTDMETCMKMFRIDLLKDVELVSSDFRIEPELTSVFLKKGIPIKEVPINYMARTVSTGKKIRAKDALLAIIALFRFRFNH